MTWKWNGKGKWALTISGRPVGYVRGYLYSSSRRRSFSANGLGRKRGLYLE